MSEEATLRKTFSLPFSSYHFSRGFPHFRTILRPNYASLLTNSNHIQPRIEQHWHDHKKVFENIAWEKPKDYHSALEQCIQTQTYPRDFYPIVTKFPPPSTRQMDNVKLWSACIFIIATGGWGGVSSCTRCSIGIIHADSSAFVGSCLLWWLLWDVYEISHGRWARCMSTNERVSITTLRKWNLTSVNAKARLCY